MYIPLSIFILSFVGMASVIVVKLFEMRSGKKLALGKLSEKYDRHLSRQTGRLKMIIGLVNKENGHRVLYEIVHSSVWMWTKVRSKADSLAHKAVNFVRREHVPKSKGTVSFFLKDISGHKDVTTNKKHSL